MKIQCDVCNKDQASVFCTADDAALCDGCDHRVHHANKLASKHQRFSLLNPSSKQFPICDICQEKRALLFCQQDRAILCSDCDVPIHSVNEHTKKHNRFLLTGVKLSASACVYKSPPPSNGCDLTVPDPKPQSINTPDLLMDGIVTSETSSISEYLQMLPGWQMEDLLDSSPASTQDYGGKLPFMDSEFEHNISHWSTKEMGFWVPKATVLSPNNAFQMDGLKGINQRMFPDDCFTVPQINPSQIAGSKRARTLW
jgi:hypothetical protein